jgi:hypothetical protein
MKHLFLTTLLLPTLAFAQALPARRALVPGQPPMPGIQPAQNASEPFPNNYQINLAITDKDSPPVELSVVVVSSPFNVSLGEQNVTFTGSMLLEDGGTLLVQYGLGWQTAVNLPNNNVTYHSTSSQGSVRIKPGEEVEIFRAGTRVAKLVIKKL